MFRALLSDVRSFFSLSTSAGKKERRRSSGARRRLFLEKLSDRTLLDAGLAQFDIENWNFDVSGDGKLSAVADVLPLINALNQFGNGALVAPRPPVAMPNDPPVVTSGTELYGDTVTGGLSEFSVVVSNDDCDALEFTIVAPPQEGVATITQTGRVTFQASAQTGSVAFVAGVSDRKDANGRPDSEIDAMVTIRVDIAEGAPNPDPTTNQPPVITSSTLVEQDVQVGTQVTHQIVATDPNGDTVQYIPYNIVEGVSVDTNGVVTFTASQMGSVAASFEVTDGQVREERQHVTLRYTVVESTTPQPEPEPILNAVPVITSSLLIEKELAVDQEERSTIVAMDPEGKDVRFAFYSVIAGATLSPEGEVIFKSSEVGVHSFAVSVSDDVDRPENLVTFRYTVSAATPTPDPVPPTRTSNVQPVVLNAADFGQMEARVSSTTPITGHLRAFDADGDELFWTIEFALPPGGGTATIDKDGWFSYMSSDQSDTYAVVFGLSDHLDDLGQLDTIVDEYVRVMFNVNNL